MDAGGRRDCLLSFIDKNYVGFRRISIRQSWVRGEDPDVEFDGADSYGQCIHLSTDAFVEFEDMVRGSHRTLPVAILLTV